MKKQSVSIITLVIIIILGIFLYINKDNTFTASENSVSETKMTFLGENVSFAKEITCTYIQTLQASYSNGEIIHSLPPAEGNPIISTFSKLDDVNFSNLNSIDATQNITSYPLVKLVDNDDKYVFIDSSSEYYLTIHTIYKNTGVSTYVKNTDFFGVSQSTVSAMGTCIGY